MLDIQKYKHTEIIICAVANQQTPPDVAALLNELNIFEREVDLLIYDLSKVDKTISNFRDSCNAIAEYVEKLGTSTLDLFMRGDSSKAKGGVGIVALAIKAFGYASEKYKQREALKEYNEKKDAILQQKMIMAEAKLPHITELYQKFNSGVKAQLEKLYDKEFSAATTYDDNLLEKRALIFKKNLCMIIKARFLGNAMHYCIEEMEAWIRGKHNSNAVRPSIERELSLEFKSWSDKLGHRNSSFDDMINRSIYRSSGRIAIPIATILTDPCLLRNYVGISIGEADNCPRALINLNTKKNSNLNRLVKNNPYYLHCKKILNNEYRPPRNRVGFSIGDLIMLMLLPAALFGALLLLFHWEQSTLWRIFFLFPIFCWVGLGIEAIEKDFDKYFPYVSRLQKYNDSFEEFRRQIIEKENCKEFHILG